MGELSAMTLSELCQHASDRKVAAAAADEALDADNPKAELIAMLTAAPPAPPPSAPLPPTSPPHPAPPLPVPPTPTAPPQPSFGQSSAALPSQPQDPRHPCRDPCRYGANCYQKNPQHRLSFSHPGDVPPSAQTPGPPAVSAQFAPGPEARRASFDDDDWDAIAASIDIEEVVSQAVASQ